MAGSGGSNEIVVRLAMEMRGAGKAVTDKIKKDAGQNGAAAGKAFMAGIAKEAKKAESSSSGFDIFAGTNRSEKAAEVRGARAMGAFMKGVSKASKRAEKTIPGFDVFGGIKNEARARNESANAAKAAESRGVAAAAGFFRGIEKESKKKEAPFKSNVFSALIPDVMEQGAKKARREEKGAAWNRRHGLRGNGRGGEFLGESGVKFHPPGTPPPGREESDRESMLEIAKNPAIKALKWATLGASAMVISKMMRGVGLNRQHSAAGMQVAGLENYDPTVHNIHSGRYKSAAQMGRSPSEYLGARAAGLRATGGDVGGTGTLALMGNTGWSAGQAETVMGMSKNRGANVQSDVNKMFGVALGAGFKHIARQQEFVKAFAEFMSKAHSYGGTTGGMGRVVSTISNRGGAVGGMYAMGVASQLQAGFSGGDPMSSQAAFGRLMVGYGKPGSKMGFFQAEAARRKGLTNPKMLPKIMNELRTMTNGDQGAMAYMLVNQYGVSQAEAERLVGIRGLSDIGGSEDKFSVANAANKTPAKAARYAGRDLTAAKSTARLTDSLDKLDDAVISVASEFERLAKAAVNTTSALFRKFGDDKAGGEGGPPPMPGRPSPTGKSPEEYYTAVKAYQDKLKERATSRQASPVQASEALTELEKSKFVAQQAKKDIIRANVPNAPEEAIAAAAASTDDPGAAVERLTQKYGAEMKRILDKAGRGNPAKSGNK